MPSFKMYRQGESVYIMSDGPARTWQETEDFAQSLDAAGSWHLASLNTATEAAWVATILPADLVSFIGLRQPDTETRPTEGWTWTDGTTATYFQWAPPEPNDYYGPGSEQVGEVYGPGFAVGYPGFWNDALATITRTTAILETSALTGFALTGTTGNDLMRGGDGGDVLIGGRGKDTINGGLGQDTLTGGGGADIYRPESVADCSATSLDRIRFFSTEDVFDFTLLSAQAHFDGGSSFTGEAGEIIVRSQTIASGTRMLVFLDVDGDRVADAGYSVLGSFVLTDANFVELI